MIICLYTVSNTGYFIANLLPCKYGLTSEVHNASKKNMLKRFEIFE